jgi:hypothetical protein
MSIDPHELHARLLRLLAAAHRKRAAELDMAAQAALATRSVNAFADAYRASEAREFAEHPDIAETLAQLEGFYGPAD